MLDNLKKLVCEANLQLVSEGLVIQTFGNVSGIDRKGGMVVIKPSGVSYDSMEPRQMVVVSLADGRVVEAALRPSSDTPTHLELYRAMPALGGIVHTHSPFATAWRRPGATCPPTEPRTRTTSTGRCPARGRCVRRRSLPTTRPPPAR